MNPIVYFLSLSRGRLFTSYTPYSPTLRITLQAVSAIYNFPLTSLKTMLGCSQVGGEKLMYRAFKDDDWICPQCGVVKEDDIDEITMCLVCGRECEHYSIFYTSDSCTLRRSRDVAF